MVWFELPKFSVPLDLWLFIVIIIQLLNCILLLAVSAVLTHCHLASLFTQNNSRDDGQHSVASVKI
jgi:cell division protein FtsL